jgi:hypothetical protein
MTKLGVADRGAGDGGRPALEMLRLDARRVLIEAPPQPPASCGGTRQHYGQAAEEGGRFRDSADGRRVRMVGSWWRVDTAGLGLHRRGNGRIRQSRRRRRARKQS